MPRVKVPVPIEKAEIVAAPPPPVITVPPRPAQTLPPQSYQQGSKRFSTQQLMLAGCGLVVMILLVFVVNLTRDRNHLARQVSKLSDSSAKPAAGTEETKQLVAQIGQIFQLPAGETPTLATVTDVNKVRGQAFFNNAQNGDKVLLYSKAGEAILYRPSTKKIISVAPVNLNDSSGGAASLPPPAAR